MIAQKWYLFAEINYYGAKKQLAGLKSPEIISYYF